ncbi:hypothetical protein ACIP2X_10020 [Streptomyces sp. NPDC089424]|uniref:hypothetical protein n=1 Tax=Streptomyces sp. NPDC089424 TaxID=3365917 RepID=UPI00380D526F
MTQGALAVGSIGILINVVDAIESGHFEPHDAFAALIALGAAAELVKGSRPRLSRTLWATASALLVLGGSVAGYGAWSSLIKGASYDWLDLVIGVPAVLHVAVGAAASAARRSRRASKLRDDGDMVSP